MACALGIQLDPSAGFRMVRNVISAIMDSCLMACSDEVLGVVAAAAAARLGVINWLQERLTECGIDLVPDVCEGGMNYKNKRWDVLVESEMNVVTENGGEKGQGVIQSETVTLCKGPWSTLAQRWVPSTPVVMGHEGASLFVRGVRCGSTALFIRYLNASGKVREPEVYRE